MLGAKEFFFHIKGWVLMFKQMPTFVLLFARSMVVAASEMIHEFWRFIIITAAVYHSLISHITTNKIINHTDTFLSHCWPFSLLDISDFLEDTTLVICINRQRHQFTPTLDKNEIPHTPRPASWLEKVYCEGRVSLCDARIVAVPPSLLPLQGECMNC